MATVDATADARALSEGAPTGRTGFAVIRAPVQFYGFAPGDLVGAGGLCSGFGLPAVLGGAQAVQSGP